MRILASTTLIGLLAGGLTGCAHNNANQYAYAPPLAPPVYPQPQPATPMMAAASTQPDHRYCSEEQASPSLAQSVETSASTSSASPPASERWRSSTSDLR